MFNTILSTVLVFISSISNPFTNDVENYKFHGSGDNWNIVYETERSESKAWSDFSFEYIGEEPPPSMFGYNLKSNWFEISSKEEQFNHPTKNINSGNSECTGPPINGESCKVIIEEGTQLEAIIEWNGNSETIVLEMR